RSFGESVTRFAYPARVKLNRRRGGVRRGGRGTAGSVVAARATPAGAHADTTAVTYSIVARDTETGELGVAVQSQAFNTGAAVPWARPGVGAIATQSFTDRRYGWRGLELLAAGRRPQSALDELRETDALPHFRQVAFLD